jgi:RHS repeat-associated protein
MTRFINKKKLFSYRKAFAFLLLVAATSFLNTANAQFDGGIPDNYNGVKISGINLINGATDFVTCSNGTSAEIIAARKIINIIRFGLNEESNKYLPVDFIVSVPVRIEYGPNSSSPNILNQTFTITYNKAEGAKYNTKNYLSFEGAKYVKITLTGDLSIPSAGGVNLADIVYVENEMQVTRYYELQPNITPAFSPLIPASVPNPADQLPVAWTWPANTGHNTTQLEWTWLETELDSNYYFPSTTIIDPEKLFKDNATRIDLPYGKDNFNIPLFYDGIGKLYYRIRPVNIKANGSRQDGQWTVPAISAGICAYEGHNNDLNWQVRTSFAEEGKMKSVMEYYDGSLRSRQTVTKENVNNTTVTAETMYDYEGRPVIQILPVPGINNIIKYQANLNMFNLQTPGQNPAEFFDLSDNMASGADLYTTKALSTTTGTAKYYSSGNPELNSGANKNIPDAEGHPYTVTRYMPDGTGRVLAQSGVGATHKMGSGKETKYYYGTPGQEELDGLFGTEVGNYTHYFKNMVKDANGQMSVSYTDMHGRTIATALAGNAPGNLIAINDNDQVNYPNQQGSTVTRNLLNRTTNIEKGNAIESINTLLVAAPNSYTFKYKLDPQSLNLNDCNAAPICYECLYDLEISITDESGDNEPVTYTYKNLNISGTVDDDCNTHNPFIQVCSTCPPPVNNEITIVQPLEPGSYSIRKTLTISESSLQKYKDLFFQQDKGICKTEQEIIDSVYAVLLTTSDCNDPVTDACVQCNDDLGTETEFRIAYLTSLGYDMNANPLPVIPATTEAAILAAFTAGTENCNRICNTTSQLTASKRQLLLADMMPYGGQYATAVPIDIPSGTSMYNKYNIFQTGFNPPLQPYYKKPEPQNGTIGRYRDNLENYDPVIHPDGTLTQLNGTTPDEFANQFVPKWAEALLPHHPEYQRLLFSESNLATSYNWINKFNSTTTYAAAANPGPGYSSFIFTDNGSLTDPFYTEAPGKKDQMLTWVTNNYANSNYSLWQIARGQMRCQNAPDKQVCFYNANDKLPPFNDISSPADMDQLWQNFRNLYAAARDNQVNTYINEQRPLADEGTLIIQKYQLRFSTNAQTAQQYNWTWFPPQLGDPPPVLPPPTPVATYQGRCESYITQWKATLLECTALQTHLQKEQILTEITNGMVSVCLRGSDAANMYGSSTVAPSQVSGTLPNSFEQVITQVFANYSINQTNNYYCNPYVIEFPKPYGKGPKFANEFITAVDSCACAHFDSLKLKLATAAVNYTQLTPVNNYLLANNMDTLSSVLHTALLGCSGYKVWVCDTVQVSKTVSCYDPSPCDDVCQLRPGNQSESNSIESVPADCTEWNYLISCFYELYGALANSNPSSCQTDFAAHFNIFYYGNNFNWQQVDSTYRADCNPAGLNVCVSCSTNILCSQPTNCRYVFAPYFLSSPQPLPDFLKCGGWPPINKCLTCDSMQVRTTEFKTKFASPINSGPVFTGTNLSPVQLQQNILYAQFLNFRTGFQFGWMEYAQAAAASNCNPLGGGGSGVVDLVVTTRTGNTPAQYIASNSITFDPNFDHPLGDEYETLIQPNGGGGGTQTVICRDNKPLNDTTGLFVVDTPCHRTYTLAVSLAQNIYQQQLITIQANFERQYRQKCMAAKNIEEFTVSYSNKEYHYTLYYYDMAGSLVKTVPPKGVRPDFSAAFTNSVKAARDVEGYIPRPHEYVTQYRYNSLGQVIAQNSPDANTSKFWYDKLGRLVVSQNAQQAIDGKYSYTLYDALGRITEVGQKPQTTLMTQTISQDETALNNWIVTNGDTREQITNTVYDLPYLFDPPNPSGLYPLLDQQNMRNRVSHTVTKNLATDLMQYAATFYTYDIHGNVDTLLQDYKGVAEMEGTSNRFKMMTYNYDLISGKVNMVSYQPDWYNGVNQVWVHNTDAFFHKYKYDAENRLTEAWTSRDKIEWERDAAYNYYKHGPLSRTVLGQQQVQGIDYAYTIQGWLKGVNSTSVDGTYGPFDMGEDGFFVPVSLPIVYVTPPVARDIYGFALHYFDNGGAERDYKPISGNVGAFARPNNNAFVSLYNGNIGAMSVNNAGLLKGPVATTNALPLFYNYRYDQLNRIKSMSVFKGLNNNQWTPVPISNNNDYGEAISYDPNGNILTYTRNATATITQPAGYTGGVPMDNMEYEYKPNTNQLKRVTDNVPANAWDKDINTQVNPNNYTYDAIGNLKTDIAEGITNINWTVYGKISSISKSNGSTISYTYDASGNRITKTIANPPSGDGGTTIYVRDASGNVMGIYEKVGTGATELTENHLYGSSRIGIVNKLTVPVTDINLLAGFGKAYISTFTRGEKNYELSNHLGNVLVIISDKKIGVEDNGCNDLPPCTEPPCYPCDMVLTGLVHHYEADVVSATDYYPGGMDMPGRKFGAAGRYGFNGKERDKDMNSLTAYDYGFRIYNPAIGRFLSVDPLSKSYPFYTPYQFAGNKPIKFIDVDGLEEADAGSYLYADKPKIDMNGAPTSSPTNAQGFFRNKNYFWNQMLSNHPQYFSPENIKFINDGFSPWVDEIWVKSFQGDAVYMDNRLIHHHVEGKNMAVAIPEKLHWDRFSDLHAYLKRTGASIRGTRVSGALNGLVNILGLASDITGIIKDNPDAVANQFGSKGLPEDNIGRVVNQHFGGGGPFLDQYVVMEDVSKETTTRYNSTGEVLAVFVSARYYRASIYSDYVWDEDLGKYRGVNLYATQIGVIRYNQNGKVVSEVGKRSDMSQIVVDGDAPQADIDKVRKENY